MAILELTEKRPLRPFVRLFNGAEKPSVESLRMGKHTNDRHNLFSFHFSFLSFWLSLDTYYYTNSRYEMQGYEIIFKIGVFPIDGCP